MIVTGSTLTCSESCFETGIVRNEIQRPVSTFTQANSTLPPCYAGPGPLPLLVTNATSICNYNPGSDNLIRGYVVYDSYGYNVPKGTAIAFIVVFGVSTSKSKSLP